MLELEQVSKSYGKIPVLDRISCVFRSGAVSALVGPNGAGKSTMLNIMGRLLAPSAGTVKLHDRPLGDWPKTELSRHLAILRQSSDVRINITVQDLVAMGRFPYSHGRLTDEDQKAVEHGLEICELTGLRQRSIHEISGGQRQRAFLAMVIAQDCDVLLLDEPLSNLDLRHSLQTMRMLRRLAADKGKAVILVMHDINLASAFSDEIYALQEQRLYYTGEAQGFFVPEHLEAVFGVTFTILQNNGRAVCLHY